MALIRVNATAAHTFAAALKRHSVHVMFGQSIPSQLHLAAPVFGIRQVGYRTENAGAAMADGYARVAHRAGVVRRRTARPRPSSSPGSPRRSRRRSRCSRSSRTCRAGRPTRTLSRISIMSPSSTAAPSASSGSRRRTGSTTWSTRRSSRPPAAGPAPSCSSAPTTCSTRRHRQSRIAPPRSVTARSTGRSPIRPGSLRLRTSWLRPDPRWSSLAAASTFRVPAGRWPRSSRSAALPVATTTMGKGAVDESHPLSVGVIGYYMGTGGMAKFQRPLIDRVDVILLIGTRTNQNGTDSWSLFPDEARMIHVDADPEEIGRNYEALRLVGDARTTLAALLDALRVRGLGVRRAARGWLETAILAGREKHVAEARPLVESDARPIRPERLVAEIDRRLTPGTIVVADASYASIWVGNYLRSRCPGMRFVTPRGIAGLGWGLPLALGAKVARPTAPVLCLAGDGGFAHSSAELKSVRRIGLSLVLTVLNTQGLGYQRDWEDRMFGSHTDVCHFGPVNHAKIAQACGWRAVRIEDPADYGAALDDALRTDEPTLIDARARSKGADTGFSPSSCPGSREHPEVG